MNNLHKKIDSYLLALLLELFLLVTLSISTLRSDSSILNFVMLCVTFFALIITYVGGMVVGLIVCSVSIFTYASYIFYMNLIKGTDIQTISYIWMIFIPLLSFTMGKFSDGISELQKSNIKLLENQQNLVTIDQETCLKNIRLFYSNLDKEISKAKRHHTPCTLMLIKLPYYKDIKNIIGQNETNKLMRYVGDIILQSIRNEDDIYVIEHDTLAVIMPVTNLQGASIVKNRIKQRITDFNLDLRSEKKQISVDTKISVVEYKKQIKNSMEFKLLAEEELQYDV